MASRTCSQLANSDWNLFVTETTGGGVQVTTDRIQTVLLWEILQELKRLNGLLHCHNFQQIPATLRAINRKTPDPKRKKP